MLGGLFVAESAIEVVSLINYTQNSLLANGFSIWRKPIAVISPKRKKQIRIATRCALSDDRGGGIVVDKEFEFTPSFGEYLKAMESVKTDRNSNNNSNDDDSSSIRSNASVRKKKGFKKIVKEEEKSNDGVQEKSRKGNLYKRSVFSKEDSRKGDFCKEIDLEKFDGKKSKDSKIRGGKRSGGSESEFLDMERAAFKSLECEDNVVDKPRVTKADMEERIQKLAKGLNGADVNMPEWKFSEMMRSAQIRFSDHSIMRIIQILGNPETGAECSKSLNGFSPASATNPTGYDIFILRHWMLLEARRPVEALNLFRRMQEQMASYPDIAAYHCIAVTLGQAGYMKELFDVIDTMRSPPKKNFKNDLLEKWDPRLEPDVIVYNAVLNACVRRKKWEGAFGFYSS